MGEFGIGAYLFRVLGGAHLAQQGFLVDGGRSSFTQQLGIARHDKVVILETLQAKKQINEAGLVSTKQIRNMISISGVRRTACS